MGPVKSQPRSVRGAKAGEGLAVATQDGLVVLRIHVGDASAAVPLHAGSALKLAEQLLRHGRKRLIPKAAPAPPEATA